MKPAVGSAAERNSHKAIDEKSQERKRQTNLCSVKALPGCFNFHRFHLRKLQYEFSILCNQLIRDPGFSIQIKISFHDHAPHFNLKTSSFQISILYYAFRTAGPFSSLKIKNSPAHHALQHSGIQDLLSPEFCDIFGIQALLKAFYTTEAAVLPSIVPTSGRDCNVFQLRIPVRSRLPIFSMGCRSRNVNFSSFPVRISAAPSPCSLEQIHMPGFRTGPSAQSPAA